LRNVYFGQVTDPNTADVNGDGRVEGTIINGQAVETEHPIWGAKIITDLSVGFKITETAKVVIGANNIFDIYPDANLGTQTAIRPRLVSGAIDYNAVPSTIDLSNANQFVYSRNTSQFGQNGRFLFARLNFSF
jgi:iron complex outermembrane receptor protein